MVGLDFVYVYYSQRRLRLLSRIRRRGVYPTLQRLPEPLQEPDDGRFPTSRGTNDRYAFSWIYFHIEVFEDSRGGVGWIGERDVGEDERTGGRGEKRGWFEETF